MNNYNEETTDEVMDQASEPAKRAAQKVGNIAKRKMQKESVKVIKKGAKVAKKGVKVAAKAAKAVAKAAVKVAKVAIDALLTALAPLLPYIAVAAAIMGIIVLAYFIIFEFTGTEKEYTKKHENEIEMSDDGVYRTSESQINGQNKIIRDFYKYFAGQSYWILIKDDNENLISPDDEIVDEKEIKDHYKREELFKLPANLLYSLDDYMFDWTWKYPEQFIKPVQFDKEDLKLLPLSDEDRIIIAESKEQDIETGEETGETIVSVRDYGLGSVLKYNEKDDYKRKVKVKGEYIAKDVWNPDTKEVETITLEEPEPFDLVMENGETDIWLIDKAILFNGSIEFIYEIGEQKLRGLKSGVTSDERVDVTEYIYETYWEETFEIEEQFNEETGEVELVEVPGEPIPHELKKYRSEESAVIEELPVVAETITEDKGQDYFEDYLWNFEAYAPIDIMEDFEFEDRIDYDSYIFDLSAFDYSLGLGTGIDSADFHRSLEYMDIIQEHSSHFDVDPFLIVAMMAQESGGNPHINGDGLMQITGTPRSVIARNSSGTMESFEISTAGKQDPYQAIKFGVMYFKARIDSFDGDPYKAIQSYNFGPETMNTLRDLDPAAWSNGSDWLIYREAARLKHAPPGKSSASYGCMDFPEGTMPVVKGNLWGNSCHLEMVLQYYGGENIERGDIPERPTGFFGSKFKELGEALSGFFKNFTKKRDPKEIVPKFEFINHVGQTIVDDVLMTTKALDRSILFSETNLEDGDLELSFWEDGFMDAIGAIGMSLQDIMDIAPNAEGYLPPIIMEGLRVSSPFGPRIKPNGEASSWHPGIDIAAPIGTPVYAIASGVVKVAQSAGKAGIMLTIDHGGGVTTTYMHLKINFFKPGDTVEQGENVAESGNTGNSTGPHLHFEFRLNGAPKDPIGIILGQ